MAKLKTDWKVIGRSGATVDGREIEENWLTEAAEAYDKKLFSCPIWYSHNHWYRLGTVEAIKTVKNNEGGADLMAELVPNDYYRQSNKEGQLLHTSMELRPDFRGTGKWYLTGLAATDEPASAGTEEMEFSQKPLEGEKNALFTDSLKVDVYDADQDQAPHWFTNFFKKNTDDDMSKEEFLALKQQVVDLEQKLSKLSSEESGDDGDAPEPKTEMQALTEMITSLAKDVKSLSEVVAQGSDPEGKPPESGTELSELQKQVKKLSQDLQAAISEENGTPAGENLGEKVDSSDLI